MYSCQYDNIPELERLEKYLKTFRSIFRQLFEHLQNENITAATHKEINWIMHDNLLALFYLVLRIKLFRNNK